MPDSAKISEPAARPSAQDAINRQALDTEHLMATIGRRAASGGLIALAAQAIRMLLALATSAVMARLLGPQDFGLVAMAATVTGFVVLFADTGLTSATVQRKEIDQETVSSLLYFNLFTSTAAMLAAFACAPVAAWAFADDRVLWLVMALALSIPVATAGAQPLALLQRGMRWTTMHAASVVGQAVGSIVGILLAWKTDAGYWALVVNIWTTEITSLSLVWLMCRWRPSAVFRWSRVRSALQYGLNLTGFGVLNYFHRQVDNLLVGAVWGPVELGYYTRAYGLFMMPLTAFNWPLASAVVPALSRLQSEPVRWRELYLTSIAAITIISAPMSGVLFTFAEPIVLFLFGAQWAPTVPIFRVLAFSMLIQPIYSSAGWIYISLGRTDRLLQAGTVATVCYCCAFIIGVRFGALGVATAYTCAVALVAPVWSWWAVRGTAISLVDIGRVVSPPIVGTLIACASVAMIPSVGTHPWIDLSVQATAFAAVYLLCAMATWFHFATWRTLMRPALAHAITLLRPTPCLST